MKIVAKTDGGVLIEATNDEVSEIIRSVSGASPKELVIGQKIPAIDYAGSITKVRELKNSYNFKEVKRCAASFSAELQTLSDALEQAALEA